MYCIISYNFRHIFVDYLIFRLFNNQVRSSGNQVKSLLQPGTVQRKGLFTAYELN